MTKSKSDKPLLAYTVQEDGDSTGGIVFARSGIEARRVGCETYNGGEFQGVMVHRAPWADKYARKGKVPWIEMFHQGWWIDCVQCGRKISQDVEGEEDDDGNVIEPFQVCEVGPHVFCDAKCAQRFHLDRHRKKAIAHEAITRGYERLIKTMPGAVPDGKPHVYVTEHRTKGTLRVEQIRLFFAFPGMTIGPATFGRDRDEALMQVRCCFGDKDAFEKWQAAGYPAVMPEETKPQLPTTDGHNAAATAPPG